MIFMGQGSAHFKTKFKMKDLGVLCLLELFLCLMCSASI